MLPEDRDEEQIGLILKYIQRAESYADSFGYDKNVFMENDAFQDLISFCFIQIGESVGRLSAAFTETHHEIDWRSIYGLRCFLAHGYESASRSIVWEALTEDLPLLKRFCLEYLEIRS